MKLQLNYNQLMSLWALLHGPVFDTYARGTMDKLAVALLSQVWEKLDKKKAGLQKQKAYTLTLSRAEAIGFYLYWHNAGVPPHMIYEENLIRTINNSIHKQYIN